MRYQIFLKNLITSVVILYFLIGNFTWALYRHEFFPISSWNLFSIVPNLVTDYGLKVTSIDEVDLDSPAYIQDLPSEFAEAESIVVFYVIQNLGEAIEEGDTEAVTQLREQIESNYFSSQSTVDYEIEKRSYYPKERWNTGEYEEITRLETYEKSRP